MLIEETLAIGVAGMLAAITNFSRFLVTLRRALTCVDSFGNTIKDDCEYQRAVQGSRRRWIARTLEEVMSLHEVLLSLEIAVFPAPLTHLIAEFVDCRIAGTTS